MQSIRSLLFRPSCFSRSGIARPCTQRLSSMSTSSFHTATSCSFDESANEQPSSKSNSDTSGLLSPSDFCSSNVFVQGIPFFSKNGMAVVRVTPATFKKTLEGRFISNNPGSLKFSFYPRSDVEENKYDTTRAIRFSIRAVDVGSILEIDASSIETPSLVQGGYGGLEIAPKPADETTGEPAGVVFKGSVLRPVGESLAKVEVELTTGQFRTLQTILTHATPSLFGWQVLLDPSLVMKYMDPATLREIKEEQESKTFTEATEKFFA